MKTQFSQLVPALQNAGPCSKTNLSSEDSRSMAHDVIHKICSLGVGGVGRGRSVFLGDGIPKYKNWELCWNGEAYPIAISAMIIFFVLMPL